MSKLSDILKHIAGKKSKEDSFYDPVQLKVGIGVEREHTGNDKEAAKEIAKIHLDERKDYYKKLAKFDKDAKELEK